MQIKYIGRHTGGIFLPAAAFVEHGGTVEVDDELAAELIARGDFEALKIAKPPKATTTTEENA